MKHEIKDLRDMMHFLFEYEDFNRTKYKKILKQNGWTDLTDRQDGSICTDGKQVLIEVGCGVCYDIIIEDYDEEYYGKYVPPVKKGNNR